jgi:hypothetical protein
MTESERRKDEQRCALQGAGNLSFPAVSRHLFLQPQRTLHLTREFRIARGFAARSYMILLLVSSGVR